VRCLLEFKNKSRGADLNKSIAIVYHYYERDFNYRDNLIYFLSVGILDEYDYYIVIAGQCTINIPKKENIFIINTENKNNDYGGYSKFIKSQNINKYNFFIFINSSVRGPFLLSHSPSDWTSPFIEKLSGETHLVGSSINQLPTLNLHSKILEKHYAYPPPYVHVQTTSYALTAEALHHLISIGFYANDRLMSKPEVIALYELRLSREIIKNGWNISCVLPLYDSIDYRCDSDVPENHFAKNGNVLFQKGFLGRTLSPFELIFIKINRNMLSQEELDSYTYTTLFNHSSKDSFQECGELLKSNQERLKKYAITRKKYQRIYKFLGIRKLITRMLRVM
jgi:hypothetical protein